MIVGILCFACANAMADAASTKAYVATQLPNNSSRAIQPINVRNSIGAAIDYTTSSTDIISATSVSSSAYYGNGSGLAAQASGTTTTSRLLSSRFSDVYTPMDYGASCNGTGDDTSSVQSALTNIPASSTLQVPANSVCIISGTLEINKKMTFNGPGELRYLSWSGVGSALAVNADGVVINQLSMTNPNLINSGGVGTRGQALGVSANEFKAFGNFIENFESGIAIRTTGEYENIIIGGNRIKDSIGTATEDRGDGIVVWGALATVYGNVVNCKAGYDCRVGIHGEALDAFQVSDTIHASSQITLADNVVYGQYRRGLTLEGIAIGSITGNVVSDATFWGISINQTCYACTVTGNSILYTRTASDTQGGSGIHHTGIMVYGQTQDVVIANNTIQVTPTAVGDSMISVFAASSSSVPTRTRISDNVITALSGSIVTDGIYLAGDVGGIDTTVGDNIISGFSNRGIFAFNPMNLSVRGNLIDGKSLSSVSYTEQTGVYIDGATLSEGYVVDGNMIKNLGILNPSVSSTAIFVGSTSSSIITNNYLSNAIRGINIFGVRKGMVTNNQIVSVTVPFLSDTNTTTNAGTAVYNNSGQRPYATFTWDVSSLVAGAGETFSSPVTVSGTAVGDQITVTALTNTQGLNILGWVSSTNTVGVRVQNGTSSTIDLPSATFRVFGNLFRGAPGN